MKKFLFSKLSPQKALKFIFMLFSFLMMYEVSFAQLLHNNNIAITITGGAQLTVKGDFQNNAGTTIANNGTIDLSGSWINSSGNNCFGVSSGTVILNGTTQSIGGTSTTLFNNLTLAGAGTKTLQINTDTKGIVALGTQVLDLNSKTLTVQNSNTNGITTSTGYILSETTDFTSRVKWFSAVGTNILHTVPFGNALGEVIPVTFRALNPLAPTFVEFATYPTSASNLPFPTTPIPVTNIQSIFGLNNSPNMPDRFWYLQPSTNTFGEFSFMHAVSETAANGTLQLRAQRWNQSTGKWEAPVAGQSNPVANSALVPAVINQYGVWALSVLESPLPVDLLSFTASAKSNAEVVCDWVTATEINNDYFTVERSKDGISFDEIAVVDGAGNSNQNLNYSYIDKHPFSGLSYYRLKQTDFDGLFSYTQAVSVILSESGKSNITVFPNPTSGMVHVIIGDEFSEADFLIKVIDKSNRIIQEINVTDKYFQLNFDKQASGVYTMQLIKNDQLIDYEKVVVMH